MRSVDLTIEERLNLSIFAWISFKRNSSIICVGLDSRTHTFFDEKGLDVTYSFICDEQLDIPKEDKYDYILAVNIIESVSKPEAFLSMLKKLLKPNGLMYIGTDNRLGLRYFCGDISNDRDGAFTALEDYNSLDCNSFHNRLYAKNEIENILNTAGIDNYKCFSVLPNYSAAQLIYSEDYLPNERLATRYIPMYRDPSRVFAREEWMYDGIIANGMFHQMANSYLFEIRESQSIKNDSPLHITLSADRGEEYSCATIIYSDKVEKKALYNKGVNRLLKIKENDDDLRLHNVPIIDSKIIDDVYVMPNIEAAILERYLQNTLKSDKEEFLKVLDKYRDIVYSSSDIIDINEHGPILAKCYIDLVPLNCFYENGNFIFYDQEFYLENEPANLIMWRTLIIIYDGNPTLNAILPIGELMDRYGITLYADEYARKSGDFLRKLRNQEELTSYNKKHLRNIEKVMDNRRKVEQVLMDYEAKKNEYRETCFDNLEGKEIYVFGSGRFADEFICMYRYDYKIAGIIDNNASKHGSDFYNYKISSVDILKKKNATDYKVIVCVKNCEEILEQLLKLGVENIGVYDIHYVYPGRQKNLPGHDGLAAYQEFYKAPSVINDTTQTKKYHIGYIAGVFDLYHLGHLNMFRRAKEMCDYLIVGVVSDEGVRINKKTEPFIPFEERIEMVRSCKYVDEAVEIPFVYCRTPEAFRKYHFDVQFSGSDYENDPGWLSMKEYLEQNGATLEFFSYTQQTSSTKIKALIDKSIGKVTQANSEKKYKLGYCMATVDDINQIEWLRNLSVDCDRFVLGIPDDWTVARLYGDVKPYSAENMKTELEALDWVSEVRILDSEHLNYQLIYKELGFDVLFYGCEYGRKYVDDSKFFKDNNVKIVPLEPVVRNSIAGGGSLRLALENINRHQKIVLWGTGVYFDAYMKEYGEKYKPAYAVDNDSSKNSKIKNGIIIKNPEELVSEPEDSVFVVICCRQYKEVVEQLSQLGEFNYRTMLFKNEISLLEEYAISSAYEAAYLKKTHRILTGLVKEFDDVCQKHKLHYYVICGSLIGTVRHKGMIPWDDDIDIAMPRKDFLKLRKIAKKCWPRNGKKYAYRDYYDIGGGAFFDCMPRLFYMEEHITTKIHDKVYGKADPKFEDRAFLDIYVMDNAHESELIHNFCINCMKGIYNLMMGHRAYVDYDEYRVVIPDNTIKLMQFLHKLGKAFPLRFLAWLYDSFARSGNWNHKAKDYIMDSCAIRCIELKYPKEPFGEGKRMPFESVEIMVPSDYDAQLTNMRYRNYMEFPRLSIRKPSHYFNSDIEIW